MLLTASVLEPTIDRPVLAQQVHPSSEATKRLQALQGPGRNRVEFVDRAEIPRQEANDEDFATPALALSVSEDSPLIQTLCKATRETKGEAILDRIAEAQHIVDCGGDLKALDAQGRTALHWAVFGSSYATEPKIIVAYEKLADNMLRHGVDLNREDYYHNTALDYLLYSPNFEMQTLLIENGATSGFIPAVGALLDEVESDFPLIQALRTVSSQAAGMAPGMTFRIRLRVPVSSDASRTGDPITASVVTPVYNRDQLLIEPRAIIDGTVLFAQKAQSKYDRPRIALDFSNLVHQDGTHSPLYLQVLDVDNVRETVRNNEIIGSVQPHAPPKVSGTTAAVGLANAVVGLAIKGAQAIHRLSIVREISLPEGTDIVVQVVRPSNIRERPTWPGWPELPVTSELEMIVRNAASRTDARSKTLSHLTNILFIGSEKQMVNAFDEAGWYEAKSDRAASQRKSGATAPKTGYKSVPLPPATLDERPPDYVFQKGLNTFAKRHDVRVWKLTETYEAQEIWIGASDA